MRSGLLTRPLDVQTPRLEEDNTSLLRPSQCYVARSLRREFHRRFLGDDKIDNCRCWLNRNQVA